MNIKYLTQLMLQNLLSHGETEEQLKETLIKEDGFYLIIKKENDEKKDTPWIKDGELIAFLDVNEASRYVVYYEDILGEMGTATFLNGEALKELISSQRIEAGIEKIKVFSMVPISYSFTIEEYMNGINTIRDSSRGMNIEDDKEAGSSKPQTDAALEKNKAFLGIDRVKQALNTYESNARRKIDAGGRYENIHTLVESLLQQNKLEPVEIDKDLDLPKGYTRNFCVNIKDGNPSQGVIEKYLTYFGLREYLYVYKKDCLELIRYLKGHKEIDKYEVKAAGNTEERFKLEDIQRGIDDKGFYIYRFTLRSKYRQIQLVISNPLNYVVGREYQVVGLSLPEGIKPKRAVDKVDIMSDEAIQEVLRDLKEKEFGRKADKKKDVKSYEEKRRDDIIGYFKKQGIEFKTAEAKYKNLEPENDILDEFYKYIQTKQFGKLELFGYTAKKLVKELQYAPYDAYLLLVQLRTDPHNTKQRLKYRETDPQYQKK